MSADNCIVWYGVCTPMSPEEMQRLDRPDSPYFTPLFEAGLEIRWEKLRTTHVAGHHLLAGALVAEIGEALDPVPPLTDTSLLALMRETQNRLRRAGIQEAPQLQIHWLTDDESVGPRWLESVTRECLKIKPGNTRAELLQVFEPAGGISGIMRDVYYWHRESPYLQLTVHYREQDADTNEAFPVEDDNDVIIEMSPPYLAYPRYD